MTELDVSDFVEAMTKMLKDLNHMKQQMIAISDICDYAGIPEMGPLSASLGPYLLSARVEKLARIARKVRRKKRVR